MMRKKRGERGPVCFYQAYGGAEILGGCAAGTEDVYFLLREGARAQRGGTRGHADHDHPPGRGDQLYGGGQDFGLSRGHFVALNPRIEVASAGKRGYVTGKQMEVRSADTHRFRPDDNVSDTGGSRIRNVLDHHLAR